MYAVTGISGRVGGNVAKALLAAGERVRAIVRSEAAGAQWAAQGCEIATVEDATDHVALTQALTGTTSAFLMMPPDYDPEPGFPQTHQIVDGYARALTVAKPNSVVALSSVGAQVARFNLLNNARLLEAGLAGSGVPLACLRPAWFMENADWDVEGARAGRIEAFRSSDSAIDMVAVRDVGQAAADLMRETWRGLRVVELKGEQAVSPRDLASGFARVLEHTVAVTVVPRQTWEARFREQGMRHPEARIAMLDGFEEGWIDFAGRGAEQRQGSTKLSTVLQRLTSAQ